MLVIAPLRPCYLTWPAEIKKWADFHNLKAVVLHGENKEELMWEKADIYVINPDGIEWLIHSPNHPFRQIKCDTLCVDESTQFKHIDSLRFKLLKPVLDTFSRRWTLTGTPSPNGYLDVFGQVYVTDMGATLGPFVTAYRSEYFSPTGKFGMGWALNPGAEKQIQKRLKPIVFRLPVHHSVHVPQQIENPIYIDLPPKARKIYNTMEEDMFVKLSEMKTITALSAASAMMKCAQICSGGVYLDDDAKKLLGGVRDAAFLHDEKTNALENLSEELGGKPLLVAYDFHHDLARIQKRFGKDIPVLGGKGSTAAGIRHDTLLEKEWNKGNLPLLFGHPASVGHGLNLQQACNAVCWYSNTYNLELFDQFNRRVRRQGNPFEWVTVHLLIARNTVDEVKIDALHAKDNSQRALLQALETYIAVHKQRRTA